MLKYLVITPAYNEANYLPYILTTMVAQTFPPSQWIIVNDGSTDNTAEVVKQYAQKYDWIVLINHQKKAGHAPGAKVVKAFNLGLSTVNIQNYDFVVKLDADLSLPPNYFEKIAHHFYRDARIGLAGGICLVEKENQWIYEKIADKEHVRGPIKAYRTACFQEMNGLRPAIGWDTADELISLYHGWKIHVDNTLKVKHHRPTSQTTGQVKIAVKVGRTFYYLRYGWIISLLAAFKRSLSSKPFLISACLTMWGYTKAFLQREEPIVTKMQGKFIRKHRWQRIMKKLKKG